MRWLKGLVIGMAALIAVGMTVLFVELVRRVGDPPAAYETGQPVVPFAGAETPRRLTAFGETSIELPAGAVVEETAAEGDRLIVRLGLPDGDVVLLLIDARTGRQLGLVRLRGGALP